MFWKMWFKWGKWFDSDCKMENFRIYSEKLTKAPGLFCTLDKMWVDIGLSISPHYTIQPKYRQNTAKILLVFFHVNSLSLCKKNIFLMKITLVPKKLRKKAKNNGYFLAFRPCTTSLKVSYPGYKSWQRWQESRKVTELIKPRFAWKHLSVKQPSHMWYRNEIGRF